jgi:predicted DNA-binding protein (MmcQ/YjbR family)
MDFEDVLAYCLDKPGAWQDEPWEDSVVVKVGRHIFAFLGDQNGDTVGVKCATSRDEANEWIERYPMSAAVMPYLGRSGWNSLHVDSSIPDDEIFDAIDTSYAFVLAKLPIRDRPAQPDAPVRPAAGSPT